MQPTAYHDVNLAISTRGRAISILPQLPAMSCRRNWSQDWSRCMRAYGQVGPDGRASSMGAMFRSGCQPLSVAHRLVDVWL